MNEHVSKFKGVIALIGVLLAVFLALKSWEVFKDIKNPGFDRPTISITGEGRVFVKPDIGQVSLAVFSESKTIESAQREATEVSNRIFAVLKEKGVEEKDIKTTNYSIGPQYDFPDGSRRLLGYQVSQNFEVKIRDLSKSGEIISAASAAGANQVGGLSFTTEDPSAIQQEARDKAIEDAKQKAEKLADKLGVRIGKVMGFNEFGGVTPVYRDFALGKGGDGASFPVPEIPVGENEVVVSVNIIYQIK